MIIAISSLGETIDSPVDQRFGRCRYIIVTDTDSEEWSVHNNRQNINAAQGAGIQTAQLVTKLGAQAVITGHCGPKAFATLSAAGLQVYRQEKGSVKDTIIAFRNNKLQATQKSDVESGFGSV